MKTKKQKPIKQTKAVETQPTKKRGRPKKVDVQPTKEIPVAIIKRKRRLFGDALEDLQEIN